MNVHVGDSKSLIAAIRPGENSSYFHLDCVFLELG